LYEVFRLLHGTIDSFVQRYSRQSLVDLLEDFVPAYLDTVDVEETGIFAQLDGIHYGPVERTTFLRIEQTLLRLQTKFPIINHVALLYKAHLIFTGISLNDMNILYTYLVSFRGQVSNTKLNTAPFGRISTAASQPGGGSSSFGRAHLVGEEGFLFGRSRDPKRSNSSSSIFVPTVYLQDGGTAKLVALMYHGIMVLCLIDASAPVDLKFLDELKAALTQHDSEEDGMTLVELHPLISQEFDTIMNEVEEYKFLYHNKSNHALRLSNNIATWGGPGNPKSAAMYHGWSTMQQALQGSSGESFREINIKFGDKGWMVAKRSLERNFYLLLDDPRMSLSKCQEEVARFASIHFQNIFVQ